MGAPGYLASCCRPHHLRLSRVLGCRMGDGASALMRRYCFRFTSVLKPETGYPQQEGEGSSETGGCASPPTPCQHPCMAALHEEPGCSLVPSILVARGLTPHPAAQIQHLNPATHTQHPKSSIPRPASCVRARTRLQPAPLPQGLGFGKELPATRSCRLHPQGMDFYG